MGRLIQVRIMKVKQDNNLTLLDCVGEGVRLFPRIRV